MIALQVYFLNAMISIGRHIMANKKYEDFIYRDFIGDTISQDEFEEIMLEVLEEEEKYSLEDYLHMLQMSGDELKEYINNIKKQYPELFRYGKERICLCRELEKAKRDSDLYLICLLLCDDGILMEIDYITEKNLRSFAKYIFDVKNVEQEIEKRRTMHRKWKQLLQKLYEYDNSTSVDDVTIIDHNAIFKVYRNIYPLNKIGPYFMQNLETLAVTANKPPFNEIAPLYVYQMLTKHSSRLNKNEGLQVNQESLWKYQQYQIDFDNGKNFKANAKSIELFLDLCKLFVDSPEVDILLCQYGFIQLSNLYRFYEENCLKDGEFLIEPLESWMLEHPFSCYPNGDEDAFSFLYKHYWEKVYGFTRLYLVSSEDIAEVVQEVFIKLWEARHLIDEEQPFEGFLFIITRNMIFNYSRKKLNYSFLKVTVLQAMEQEYEEEIDNKILVIEVL